MNVKDLNNKIKSLEEDIKALESKIAFETEKYKDLLTSIARKNLLIKKEKNPDEIKRRQRYIDRDAHRAEKSKSRKARLQKQLDQKKNLLSDYLESLKEKSSRIFTRDK